MHPIIDKLRRNWRNFAQHDPEAAALDEAVDRIEVEMIHRRFARNNRGRAGY